MRRPDQQEDTVKTCNPLTFVICLVVSLGLAVPAVASPWEALGKEGGIELYKQARKGSNIHAHKGITELPYTPDKVAEVILDFDRYVAFMPNVIESKTISQQTGATHKHSARYYIRLEIPTLDDRDFIIHADIATASTPEGKAWTIAYHAVKDPAVPEVPDVIRLKKITGVWVLQPIKGGKATRLIYELHSEFGGSVPDFLIDAHAADSLSDIIKNLRARCRKV